MSIWTNLRVNAMSFPLTMSVITLTAIAVASKNSAFRGYDSSFTGQICVPFLLSSHPPFSPSPHRLETQKSLYN